MIRSNLKTQVKKKITLGFHVAEDYNEVYCYSLANK